MRRALAAAALACAMLAAVPAAGQAQASCPAGVRVRQEFRTLTADQLTRYVNAVKKLQTGTRPTVYDKLVKLHIDQKSYIHSYAVFFPWHRRFLLDFEKKLQAIDPTVTVPYWDASYDAAAPEKSPIFSASEFGGNGVETSDAISTGPFATWQPAYPTIHKLTRDFYAGPSIISPFKSASVINQQLTASTTFDQFAKALEQGQHGLVHMGIGGDMQQFQSPNDPLFWMLHAYLDKVWNTWQHRVAANATAYGGRNQNGSTAKTTDTIPGYSTGTVGGMMAIANSCYAYQDLGTTTPSTRAAGTRQAASTGASSQAVLPTTVTVASNRSVSVPGRAVTFTASIGDSQGAGAIAFAVGGTVIDGCSAVPLRFTGVTWQAACTTTGLPVGTHRVTANFTGAGAFAPSQAELSQLVVAAAPEVTFGVPARAYYGDPLGDALGATASAPGTFAYSVAPTGDAGTVTPVTASTVLDAGEYDLRATYTPADGSATQLATVPYVVDPARVTIRPESKYMVAGGLTPQFTWLASGFVNGDSPSSMGQQPECHILDGSTDVGRHDIVCFGGSSSNYTFEYPDTATLTVTAKACAADAACAADPPPSLAERQEQRTFICNPPVDTADRKLVRTTTGARPGVKQTTWRGQAT